MLQTVPPSSPIAAQLQLVQQIEIKNSKLSEERSSLDTHITLAALQVLLELWRKRSATRLCAGDDTALDVREENVQSWSCCMLQYLIPHRR